LLKSQIPNGEAQTNDKIQTAGIVRHAEINLSFEGRVFRENRKRRSCAAVQNPSA
jgi:hypothetical protein